MKKKLTEMPPKDDERTILDLPGVKGAFGSMDGLFRFGAAVMEQGMRRREKASKWVTCYASTEEMLQMGSAAKEIMINVEAIEVCEDLKQGAAWRLDMISGETYVISGDSWKLIRAAMGFETKKKEPGPEDLFLNDQDELDIDLGETDGKK